MQLLFSKQPQKHPARQLPTASSELRIWPSETGNDATDAVGGVLSAPIMVSDAPSVQTRTIFCVSMNPHFDAHGG